MIPCSHCPSSQLLGWSSEALGNLAPNYLFFLNISLFSLSHQCYNGLTFFSFSSMLFMLLSQLPFSLISMDPS